MTTSRRWAPVLAASALLLTASGCSNGSGATAESPTPSASSGSSSDQAFCNDVASAKTAVDQFISDIQAGDVTAAADDVAAVKSTATSVVDGAQVLAQSKRAEIKPMIRQLESTLKSLDKATAPSDLAAGLTTAASSFGSIIALIDNTVKCS